MRNIFVLMTIMAGLAGCGHPLPKPSDPLYGLGVSPEFSPQRVPAMKWVGASGTVTPSKMPAQHVDLRPYQNQKIGLVLSENTRQNIKWKKDEIDRINSNFAGLSWVSDSEVDALQAIDHSGLAVSVERVLKEKFRDATFVPDIHAAINQGINTVVVIDIQAKGDMTCPSSITDCYVDTESQHSLIFVDTQTRNPIAIVRGKAAITYCNVPRVDSQFAYAKCIQDGRIKSLDVLRSKLATLLPDSTATHEAVQQKSTAVPAQVEGYEENLNTINNGTPAEMYSLGLRMEQSGNSTLAGLVYQAIVRRYPDSPFSAKALERQETMISH